jgi:hypothetical protein
MLKNLDINKVIEHFDLISFLEENNINYKLEGKNIGTEWIGIETCPSCSDNRFHAALHKTNKNFTCWVCKESMWLGKFIATVKDCTKREALDILLEDMPEQEPDLVENIKSILNSEPEKPKLKGTQRLVEMPPSITISRFLIKSYKPLQDFLKARNLSREDLWEYDIEMIVSGKYKGRIVLPIFFKRKLVAFQTRHLTTKSYLTEGSISKYLYKIERINNKYPLIIVEGIFDYINTFKFIQKFYKGKVNVTTGFSKKLTYEQIKILNNLNVDTIVFILDNDSWMDYHSSSINLNSNKTDFIILPKDKDPGSLTEKEFLRVFNDNQETLSKSNSTRISASIL